MDVITLFQFVTHSACNGAETKLILNESNFITISPHVLDGRSLKYLLQEYLGLDRHQMKRLKNLSSRAVTILKSYPMCVISEKDAYVLNIGDDD